MGYCNGDLPCGYAPSDEPRYTWTHYSDGALARRVVETELSGPYPGKILVCGKRPDAEIFDGAKGHRQIMDLWLIQTVREHGYVLVTRDKALNRAWPNDSVLLVCN